MTSFYEQSNTEADRSIAEYFEKLTSMSDAVSAFGAAWQQAIEDALVAAEPGGLASETLKPRLRTAKFLAGSCDRTKKRFESFSTALGKKRTTKFASQSGARIDWGQWLAKKQLVPQLAEIAKQVASATNSAASALSGHDVSSRQRNMKGAVEKLAKVIAGFLPGGHAVIASTEFADALRDVSKGLKKSTSRPLKELVESLDEMHSLEAHLLRLESCLYLIPSAQDVDHEKQPTVQAADSRLKTDLLAFNP